MQLRTTPLTTLGVQPYGEGVLYGREGDPDRQPVEFASLHDPTTGDVINVTVGRSLNGASEPLRAVGNSVTIVMEEAADRDGKRKRRIIGVDAVPAGKTASN